jgi:hypothetical protein
MRLQFRGIVSANPEVEQALLGETKDQEPRTFEISAEIRKGIRQTPANKA